MEKDVPRRTTRRMRTSIEDRRKDEDQDKEGNRMEKDETRRTTGRMRTSIEDHRKNESKVKEDKRKLEVRCNYSMSIWSTKQSTRKLSIRIILSLIFLEKRTVLVTTAVATGGWVGCASNRFFMDVECMGCATLVFSGGGRRRLGGRQRRWVAKTPAEACLR